MIPKFRAWDKVAKEMYKDTFAVTESGQIIVIEQESVFNTPDYIFTDDLILMQSTGLFDKNGVEIFEGDIVYYESKEKTVVIFEKGTFKLQLNPFFSAPVYKAKQENIEVIGNVYENPELTTKKA